MQNYHSTKSFLTGKKNNHIKLQGENEMSLKVLITRSPDDAKQCPCAIEALDGLHWSNRTGGYKTNIRKYELFAYGWYTEFMDVVECSGSHVKYDNRIKLCIPQKINQAYPYKLGYDELLKQVGEKPLYHTAKHCRKAGLPYASVRIRELLKEQKQMSRFEIKETLEAEGYVLSNVKQSLVYLEKKGEVYTIWGKTRRANDDLFILREVI